ncbi:MAG: YbaB/EbfC family nucleoid-associated protein [Bacteroidetes bacterium]|nr:YbaB/EbfC family nucleoid-associated protein [Bacteroidota bacterium]
MFGNMLGDMKEKQKALRQQLAKITVEAESGNGAVKVTANAVREIVNISIEKNLLDGDDTEQIEDLLTVAVNRALELAAQKEAEESKKLLEDMMPPGFGNLSDMLG